MAIEEGTADVLKDGEKLRELGPGDFFGEIGVLEKELRTATVRATTPMRLIILSRWDLKRLERRDPSAFDQIRETMQERRLYFEVNRVQVGIRFPEPGHAGAALLYLTGSREHFAALQTEATAMGCRLTSAPARRCG